MTALYPPGPTRVPLRPLARILHARATGENPDRIEADNIAQRREQMRDTLRRKSARRLTLVAALSVAGFLLIGQRMWAIANEPLAEPSGPATVIAASGRADILDRNGTVLAMNMPTQSLFADPLAMTDPEGAADDLVRIFPDLDRDALLRLFASDSHFEWVRPHLSAEQRQAVHDTGQTGLGFGTREMRFYPNGPVAAHLLGGTRVDLKSADAAEIFGTAGVELEFHSWLSDPANAGRPLVTTLDLRLQAIVEEVLEGGVALTGAIGAAAVLMHAPTGEVLALASLPDYDPNDRPVPVRDPKLAGTDPTFNRAVQGVYELGSTFKIFTVAQALDLNLVEPDTMINTRGPMTVAGVPISDFHDYGPALTVSNVIVKSSNVGTARIAGLIGPERQKAFLESLGLLSQSPLEMPEARTARPSAPSWGPVEAATISYGHGISTTPLHLAAAYAAIANGGHRVTPTLIAGQRHEPGPQVLRPEVAAAATEMLRQVVDHGTARNAGVPGYNIGGKTGTAEKPGVGGYDENANIATFASIFPTEAPEYVLVVSMDEGSLFVNGATERTAGWVAAPVAGEILRRIAPLLGLRPSIAGADASGVDRP